MTNEIIKQPEIVEIKCNRCGNEITHNEYGGIEVIGTHGSIFIENENEGEYTMHFCDDSCLYVFLKNNRGYE
jgi:uncharacterized Fe-S center protein